MDIEEKVNAVESVVDCIADVIEEDDSEDDEIVRGMIDVLEAVVRHPTKHNKRRWWVKPWRLERSQNGSFAFLCKELKGNDLSSYANYVRMTEEQFNLLLNLVSADLQRSSTQMRNAVSPAERLAVTLRFLATGESFKSLDYQTRISASLLGLIIPEVCVSLYQRMKDIYLKVPATRGDWEAIAMNFALKWQFPHCLGALDGKHIRFRAPRSSGAYYYNYKGYNSIILLALVNADCQFIFVEVGCNGRCNDAGVFLGSPLRRMLEDEAVLPQESVIGNGRRLPYVAVADDAFPLQKHLMKPYPFHTTCPEKKTFNTRISRARHVVEHAFGILSNRFRVFQTTINLKVETVESIVLASCALHNFLLESVPSNLQLGDAFVNAGLEGSSTPYNPRKGVAEDVRMEFAQFFHNEGKLNWMTS